jgi:homoserine dehydrogenase
VGGAFARLLPGVAATATLTGVLVRDAARDRGDVVPRGCITTDVPRFLAALDDADVLVEAIGGLEPAHTLVTAALHAGKRVVTANKQLVAARGAEYARLVARHGGRLDFEAAVGGGVPIVRALRDGLAGVGIGRVRGILNGTTNHVLSAARCGVPLPDAIAEAQRLGFAEADPSRDLDGLDAADKLRILAWLAFGVAPHQVPVEVATFADAPERLREAARDGRVVRQVAEVAETPHGLVARVALESLAPDDPLAETPGERNRITVSSRSAGVLVFEGPGAGGDATAGALLADLRRGGGALPGPAMVRVAAVTPFHKEESRRRD